MKRKIVLVALIGISFVPLVSFASFDKNLSYGLQKDSQVKELQEFLIDQGYLTGNSTGNFFSLTLSAVKKFQTANDLPSTGYFGALSRQKTNDLLSAQLNASNNQAIQETGTTTPPVQETSTALSTAKGDAITALQNQINALLSQLQKLNTQVQTQTAVQQQTAPVFVPTSSTVTTIQISSVNVTPSPTSARIEWQTNIPTNSKIFLSGGSLSSRVYNSESGLSTRHIVNVMDLSGGITYSYEIESIAGNQDVKQQGSFSTIDKSEILVKTDKTTVQASGFFQVSFTVSVLDKSGKYDSNAFIHMDIPNDDLYTTLHREDSSSRDRIPNNITNNILNDYSAGFAYIPTTPGTKTITFTSGNLSKSVTVNAIPYVKVDPKITRGTLYQQDANNSSYPVEIPEYPLGYQGATIAAFSLSDADEPFKINEIKYESDIDVNKLNISAGGDQFNIFGALAPLNYSGTRYAVQISDTDGLSIGTHALTIKEIKAIGITSGSSRAVSGLPLTFTFKVK